MDRERIFTSIGIAAITLLLFGLGGWYLFLRNEATSIESAADARGFSVGIPSFLGSRGSTAANTSRSGAAQEFTGSSGGSAFARFLGIGEPHEGTKAESGGGGSENGTAGGGAAEGEQTGRRAPRFWRVTSAPVAGAAFVAGSSTRLRYVERASGHVFDADPRTGDITRATNTLTPRVYEAFLGEGGVVVHRVIEDNRPATLTGKIGTTSDAGLAELVTSNLGADIRDITTMPGSTDLIMVAVAGAENHLIRSAWNGGAPQQLLVLPGGDFRVQTAGSSIILTERAGSGVPGSSYRAAASLTPIVRNVPGLTLRAQADSENVLFSSDDGVHLRLFVKLPGAAAAEMPLSTTAEKCVWAPRGQVAYCAAPRETPPALFHDRWYRGEIHTSDTWHTLDTAGAKAATLFVTDAASGVDVENPVIDPSGEYLAFLNARDKSLWMLRIRE